MPEGIIGILYEIAAGIYFSSFAGSILWVREEALASVVAVELIDLPVSDIEVAIEKEFNVKEG